MHYYAKSYIDSLSVISNTLLNDILKQTNKQTNVMHEFSRTVT